jgi:hypothetical protein
MDNKSSQITDEQQIKTNKIFNIAEKPVSDFIALFLDESANVVFKDDIPTYTEPLILLPIAGYKDGVCIKFTIKPIKSLKDLPDTSLTIDSVIKHDKVKEGIGFLWYCIKEAYSAIHATAMINNKPLSDTYVSLNESDWVFRIKYASELTHKKNFLADTVNKLMYIKQNIDKFPPDMVEKINEELPKAVIQLNDVSKQLTPEIIAAEEKINESFVDKPVLGIFIEEILEKDLPKPILTKNDEMGFVKPDTDVVSVSGESIPYTKNIEQDLAELFIKE